MKKKIITTSIVFCLFEVSSFAYDLDYFSIHGYGTLGGAYQSNKDVIYRNSSNTVKGSNGNFSLANYSTLGLQLDARPTDKLTVTLQGVLSENNSNDKLLELGWANVKYQVTDTLDVRVGKMRLPAFMSSDILTVSYSYDFLRLPDMYSIIPFSNYIGVELNHYMNFNDLSVESTLLYGNSDSTINANLNSKVDIDVDNIYAASFRFLYDNLTFRVSYSKSDFSLDDKKIEAGLTQLDSFRIPVISDTIKKYQIKDTSFVYLDIGAKYDFKDSFVLGEYINFDTDSFMADVTSWYVGAGYNFEQWTPYVLYSNTNSSQNYKDIKVAPNMPPQLMGAIGAANQAFTSIGKNTSIDLETKTVGLRYHLSENTSLKFQYENQKELAAESLNIHLADEPEVNLDVFSAAISFVF